MERYANDQAVDALRLQGLNCPEIGRRLGLSRKTVYDIIKRLNNGGGVYLKKIKAITELREQGKTYKEIAEDLGLTHNQVESFCQRHDLMYSDEERRKINTERGKKRRGIEIVDWSERIGDDYTIVKTERLEGGERRIFLICNKCGKERTISSTTIRHHGKVGECVYCSQTKREAERRKKETEKKLALLNEQTAKDRIRARKRIKEKQIGLKFCSCGALIDFNRMVCDSCLRDNKREAYRRKDVSRRAREKKVQKDTGITLKKLYDRDNGICYLCGKVCDWNDCKWENKVFIVGKNYPTVEHLVPIVRGGSDTWENIKLACLSCNSKKGGREIA